MTIFGVDWSMLELAHVEAFLAGAGSEPLVREAKGIELPRPDSIAPAHCDALPTLWTGRQRR